MPRISDRKHLAVHCSQENLARLRQALAELVAEPVFLPPLEAAYLERGHACYFQPLLSAALRGSSEETESLLIAEQEEERRRDRSYWEPLRKELEALRRAVHERGTP